jgi:molecular chaperone DnaK
MSPPVLGLDLGTTNTVAAWADDAGQVHVVPVDDKSHALPSVVCFHGGRDRVLVGESARALLADDPKNTIFGAKRFLGRRYLSDYVGRNRGRFLFHLVEGADGLTAVEIRGEAVPLDEVALRLVERILELANAAAGVQFEECVVACPAHFHHRQRHALRDVVERAGLRVHAMINEPTAAALRSASTRQAASTVLVYDLGGGTFDTTLMRVDAGVVEVLGTGGDAFLGGSEFDARVVDSIVRRFDLEHGVDLRLNPIVLQRLAYAAENAKISLSENDNALVRVPCAHMTGDGFIDLEYMLTRGDIEDACNPLVERTLGIAEQTVQHAGMTLDDVDQVLLVGGQTKMPRVRQRVRESISPNVDDVFDADAGVAAGAALKGLGEDLLTDVLSVPICAMVPGAGPSVVLDRNARLPATSTLPLTRPPPGAPLPVIIYEAVDPTAIDRDVLGALRVEADWLAAHEGDLELATKMDEAYGVSFAVHVGAETRLLELTPPPEARPKATTPEPVTALHRLDDERVEAALSVIVQAGDGPLERLQLANISPIGAYVCSFRPPAIGERAVVVFSRQGEPWRLDAVVTRAIAAGAAKPGGEPPGFGVEFRLEAEEDKEQLRRFVEALKVAGTVGETTAAAYNEASTGEPTIAGTGVGSSGEALKNFLARMKENAIYEAFRVAPTASTREIEEAAEALRQTIQKLLPKASERSQKKLRGTELVIERVVNLLRDPRRRLVYDFKEGHDCVEERFAAPVHTGITDPELLKEVWGRVHPERLEDAGRARGRASRALGESDLAAALKHATEALELDPFDLETRQFVELLKKQLPS